MSRVNIFTCWRGENTKDVYVEKRCSHNPGAGSPARADKYDRIVQHCTQTRSSLAIQEAVKSLQEVVIGELYLVRGLCFKWRDTIGRDPQKPVPAGVRHDLWTATSSSSEAFDAIAFTTRGTGDGNGQWRCGQSGRPPDRRGPPRPRH